MTNELKVSRGPYGLRGDELMHETPERVIRLSIHKVYGGSVVMALQEWERDGNGFESFVMFQSWGPTVARRTFPVFTERALRAFYAEQIGRAREMVAARVAAPASGVTS